jgi:hypothetical protein
LSEKSLVSFPMNWLKATVACPSRTDEQLRAAGRVLGASLLVAIDSAITIELLRHDRVYPVSPHASGFVPDAWSALQTMLVEERRLIEFLVGPHTRIDKNTGAVYNAYGDAICTNCFALTITDTWWMSDPIRDTLRGRAQRTNKRVAHFSWIMVTSDARTLEGTWQTGYLREITAQFENFTGWLTSRRPTVANVLMDAYVSPALVKAGQLAEPGPPY